MTESDIRALSRMTPDAVREAARPYYTKRQGEYTVEDYRALPEDVRAELIDGVLIFLEAPTFTHQELIAEILFDIQTFIRKNKGPCRVVPSPLDVQLDCDDRTMVQPDIAVICRNEPDHEKGRLRRAGSVHRGDLGVDPEAGLQRQDAKIHGCRRPGILDRGSETGKDRMLYI